MPSPTLLQRYRTSLAQDLFPISRITCRISVQYLGISDHLGMNM
jgi:hypothetical protein